MRHSFNVEIALKFGIDKALLIDSIAYWVAYNMANEKHFIDGKFWVYNTASAWMKLLPELSGDSNSKRPFDKISRLLRELENDGVIVSGVFNDDTRDKTKWYSISDEFSYVLNDFMLKKPYCNTDKPEPDTDKYESSDGNTRHSMRENPNSIRNNNQDNSNNNSNTTQTDNSKSAYALTHESDFLRNDKSSPSDESLKTQSSKQNQEALDKPKQVPKFQKPTLEELESYKAQQGLNLDTRYFYDYYESNGWLVGKNKMKDWRATMRNWSRRENSQSQITKPGQIKPAPKDFAEQKRQREASVMARFLGASDEINVEVIDD